MARAVSEIETEIRALEPNDQERLLRALLEELDGPPLILMSIGPGLRRRSGAVASSTQAP